MRGTHVNDEKLTQKPAAKRPIGQLQPTRGRIQRRTVANKLHHTRHDLQLFAPSCVKNTITTIIKY